MVGLRELEHALSELPKATGRNVLRRALTKAAEPVVDAWQAKAPRDQGHYAASIHVGTQLTPRQRHDAKKEGKSFAEVYVGTADPAGQQQEFGNVNHPAQPSGRPAWEETRDEVLDSFGNEAWSEIDKAAARLARKAARLAAKG